MFIGYNGSLRCCLNCKWQILQKCCCEENLIVAAQSVKIAWVMLPEWHKFWYQVLILRYHNMNFSPHELQSFYCFTYSTTQKPVFAWVISKIRCINYRIATRGFWLSAHAFKQIKGFLRYEIIFSTYIALQNLHRNLLWKLKRYNE